MKLEKYNSKMEKIPQIRKDEELTRVLREENARK